MTSPEMVPQYSLRTMGRFGWAVITVNERIGMLQVSSDWGNWNFRWSHPGMPFKAFLIELDRDPGYLIGKLTADLRQYAKTKKQLLYAEEMCMQFFTHVYRPVFVPLLQAEMAEAAPPAAPKEGAT